ncbi:hypothetical protein MKZ38_005415 [Zalerion maritima]|uniref:DUF2427 domain-containing protein n=1 Tax=Zalerion maritima TaxID=339359 RepID=A0AAD5WPA7_9PEZI|nr:hypothetical protein MKZ38_005415 [Zalerion maritima]
MSVAWVFMLPTALMLSLAKSWYTPAAQVVFLATNAVQVMVGTIYNAKIPGLYPNSLRYKFGWAMMILTAVHVLIGLTARVVGVFRRTVGEIDGWRPAFREGLARRACSLNPPATPAPGGRLLFANPASCACSPSRGHIDVVPPTVDGDGKYGAQTVRGPACGGFLR